MNWDSLPKPFFVLAPMDDVTDTVFRRVVADCAPANLYFTEFVNVDGLQSPGRPRLIRKLKFVESEKSLVAHIWGLKPENFYKTAQQIADGTFQREIGLPSCPVHHSSSSSSFSRQETEQVVSKYDEVSTAAGKSTGAEQAGSVSGAARKQDGRCVCGYVGIDLNMGCPVKAEVNAGACCALINNRDLAKEIIQATQEGAGGRLPVSVKTRLGFNEVDMSWPEFLLKHELSMLTMHCRTRKDMSKVPARHEHLKDIVRLRDELATNTKIVANGDIASRRQGEELAETYGLDGVMIGRGVFHDPYVFNQSSPWHDTTKERRIELFKKHVQLFADTWKSGERAAVTLNKFCKIYVNGFDGAKEMREKLMSAGSAKELLDLLNKVS